jgi:inosine-uridine nucleoside N-ribohydrolase
MNVCRESGLRLILDTDPGVDDAIAILLALAAPRVDVAGLTTLGGNVPRARATRNALALLQAAGRLDIPVAQGAARPLTGRFRPSVAFHGPGGLSARLPEPASGPVGETAMDFLEAQLDADPGGVTVVALGPLTNLARLERRRPGILARSAGVVIMGGAVETRGNVSPRAEFNFHSDPLAASQVLDLDIPIMLADLAACRQTGISRAQSDGLESDTPLGRLALRILRGWFARDPERERFEFYDPLAVALALDPGVATVRRAVLAVGIAPGEHWGETTVASEPGPVSVAAEVNAPRFFALLSELLGWRGL